MRCILSLLASLALLLLKADGASYYVSPTGSGVVGSLESPMGLSNALKSGVSPASAGDTIWLRGGTYSGQFTCNLSAPSNNPIVIRNYNRERATLDATYLTNSPLNLEGSGCWVWGLELINSATNRYTERQTVNMNSGTAGTANKLINCLIHDLGNAIFVSYQSTNAEVYGCVIYNNGYQGASRGHGHNLYVQNRDYGAAKTKYFSENIGLNVFDVGVNVRSSFPTVNMVLRGNVIVNSGALSTNGYVANFHTEGDPLADQITFDQNFSWYPSQVYGGNFWTALTTNGTITLTGNVFANTYAQVFSWTNVIFNGNTQFVSLEIRPAITNYTAANYNQYYAVAGSVPIRYDQTNLTLAQWQSGFGNDLDGAATASSPSGTWVYVRPNAYEANRANIIIYNWDTNGTVSVDVSGVLAAGDVYEVRNAANFYGAAVVGGTYSGGNITLPMTNLSVATPVGIDAPAATDPRFNVFVLGLSPNQPFTLTDRFSLDGKFQLSQ